jgi:hypothetical protein
MFRLLLGALFFLSSTVAAFAEEFNCTWCRGRGIHYPPLASHDGLTQQLPTYPGGMSGAFALAVIYPGLVVLMTMAARYFLGAAEGGTPRDRPDFARNAAALSALWLIGFYPFLSTPLGGFLFLLTGLASVAGWAAVRRFGLELKLAERLLVLWAFFFFSLAAGIIAAGYGRSMGAAFEDAWDMLRNTTNSWGPFLLAAVNVGALWLVFNMAGITAPTDPAFVLRAKIYGVIGAVAVLDTAIMAGGPHDRAWMSWPLMALPSLAYYGAYRLVLRLPEDARPRTGFVLFSLLALFLMLLACFAGGAPLSVIFACASAVALLLSLGRAIVLLWRSGVAHETKFALSLISAALVCGGVWLTAWLQSLSPETKEFFTADTLLPGLLGVQALIVLVPAYGFGVYLMLAQKLSRSASYALGAVMVTFLLFALACAELAGG